MPRRYRAAWQRALLLALAFPLGRRRKLVSDIARAVRDDLLGTLAGDVAAERYSTVEPWVPRCERCGWPLVESIDNGCVPGNCSQRAKGP